MQLGMLEEAGMTLVKLTIKLSTALSQDCLDKRLTLDNPFRFFLLKFYPNSTKRAIPVSDHTIK